MHGNPHRPAGGVATARRPLFICVVTETFPPEVNGVAMTLERVTGGLTARGHRLFLVRPRQHAGDSPGENGMRTALIPSLPLPMYRELRVGLAGRRTFDRLWTAERPDVIYVATEGPAGRAAVNQAARMGIPVVSGFHTHFHQFSRFYGLGVLQGRVFRYLRDLHNRTRFTVVPTPMLQAELLEQGFDNVRVIARGADCSLYAPRRRDPALREKWGVTASHLAVLHVGRMAPEKSPEVAVEAFRAIERVAPGARLVMVGDGPARKTLERENPDVVFAGMRRGEDLAAHYASGDLLLFPSQTETFGNVTLEAMASGLGVVAYDMAGARDLILHRRNGMKAEPGDWAGFVRMAGELAGSPALLADVREAARKTAETRDWGAVVTAFEDLLAACVEDAP
jgi:glycosyltransferase involved in cell wall biosynthesis